MVSKLRFISIFVGLIVFANSLVFPAGKDGVIDPSFNLIAIATGESSRIDCFLPLQGGKILVGGAFANLSGGVAGNIARLNSDGSFDSTFLGNASSFVKKILPSGDGKFLISGDFLQYGGVNRNRIARINPDGTLDLSFQPNFGSDFVQIQAVQDDGKIIVSGNFLTVNGVSRVRLARLHGDGTLDLSFVVGEGLNSGGVERAFIDPTGKIFLAGRFSSYNNVPRNGYLRLNSDGSLDTSFVPPSAEYQREIYDVSTAPDGKVFIVGYIDAVYTIRRINENGSIDTSFDTSNLSSNAGRIVSVLTVPDGKVLIGGEYDSLFINGQLISRYRLARLNSNGTLDSSFTAQAGNSSSGGGVRVIRLMQNKLLIGGDFSTLNGLSRGGIGRLEIEGVNDTEFVGFLGSPSTVYTICRAGVGKTYIGGDFNFLGTSSKRYIARINDDGSVDESFQPDAQLNGRVQTIAVQPDGKVLIGGFFGVRRLNPNGSLDPTFLVQFGSSEPAWSIAVENSGNILIAGGFNQVNGVSRRAIARVGPSGVLDTSFVPEIGGLYLLKVELQDDGKILVGGSFSSVNGVNTRNFARLNNDGTIDTQFGIGISANNVVSAIELQENGKILVGGNFSSFNGSSRPSIVKLMGDGAFDPSFKPVRISSNVSSIVTLPSNKILVSGTISANINVSPRKGIIRLLEDGSVDFSFSIYRVGLNTQDGNVYQIGLLDDGQILATGQFNSIDNVTKFGIAKFKRFGQVDPALFDFDGDGRSDIGVFRPMDSIWYRINSYFDENRATQWGVNSDKIVPEDFDGDNITDIAVFRPETGQWYIINSSDNTARIGVFGTSVDVPSPKDFDGDGKADLAIYRQNSGVWWINGSRSGVFAIQFGASGDRPVPADYDGDGVSDIAIFRPKGVNGAEWWIRYTATGVVFATQFGDQADRALPGDYTGDGKADVTFWRPSTGHWYILRSDNLSYYSFPFGSNGDIPLQGDFDGDLRSDAAVFRPSTGVWYIQRSTAGTLIRHYGLNGDLPLPNAYVR